MVIKTKIIMYLFMILFLSNISEAAEKILIERYEHWNHPILAVFKKYGITLYKVSYSPDGKCPTFYGKFKYSPDTRDPMAKAFQKVYFEALKANSFFPYVLVDQEEDILINVSWEDRKRTIMVVDMQQTNSVSICNNGKKK